MLRLTWSSKWEDGNNYKLATKNNQSIFFFYLKPQLKCTEVQWAHSLMSGSRWVHWLTSYLGLLSAWASFPFFRGPSWAHSKYSRFYLHGLVLSGTEHTYVLMYVLVRTYVQDTPCVYHHDDWSIDRKLRCRRDKSAAYSNTIARPVDRWSKIQ